MSNSYGPNGEFVRLSKDYIHQTRMRAIARWARKHPEEAAMKIMNKDIQEADRRAMAWTLMKCGGTR